MIRKMLLIASAIAIPLGATAVSTIVGPTIAGATSTPIVCHPTTPFPSVTYAAPGLSNGGSFSSSSTSTATTNHITLNCGSLGSGAGAPNNVTTNSTMCTGTNTPVTGCSSGMFNYGNISAFAGGANTLWQAIPTVTWTIGSTTYSMNTNSSNVAAGCQAVGEAGFTVHGVMTVPSSRAGHAAKEVICFGADSGPGTSGSTTADLGNTSFAGHITSSVIDANSKIRVA